MTDHDRSSEPTSGDFPLDVRALGFLNRVAPQAIDALLEYASAADSAEVFQTALEAGCATDSQIIPGSTSCSARTCGLVTEQLLTRLTHLIAWTLRTAPASRGRAFDILSIWARQTARTRLCATRILLREGVVHRNAQLLGIAIDAGLNVNATVPSCITGPDSINQDETPLNYAARHRFVDGFAAMLATVTSEPLAGWPGRPDDPGLLLRLSIDSKELFEKLLDVCAATIPADRYAGELQRVTLHLSRHFAKAILKGEAIRATPKIPVPLLGIILARGATMPDPTAWHSILVDALEPGATMPIDCAGKTFWECFLDVRYGEQSNWLTYLARSSHPSSAARCARALVATLHQACIHPDTVVDGMTLLKHAAAAGNVDCVRALLAAGATPVLGAIFTAGLTSDEDGATERREIEASVAAAAGRNAIRGVAKPQ